MMIFGSLFSGIGGFDLGLERAGLSCAWQVEIDPYCQKVLQKHWPDVQRYSDVRNVGKHNLKSVDLICGGFPCQPHSLAGKRRGEKDDRNLWPEYRRIIEELKPSWVIGENVPGIKTTILDQVLFDLENLGYETATFVIPVAAFDAIHRRDRVFIVANFESKRTRELSIFSEKKWQGEDQDTNRCNKNVTDINCSRLQEFPREQLKSVFSEDGVFKGSPLNRTITTGESRSWWSVEPGMGRMVHGVPRRVDRIRALGNAVVPQVVEWIGKGIMEVSHDI